MRRVVNFESNIRLRTEHRKDTIFVTRVVHFGTVGVNVLFEFSLANVLEEMNLLDDIVVQLFVERFVNVTGH